MFKYPRKYTVLAIATENNPRRTQLQLQEQYHHEELGEEGHGSGGEHHGEGDRVEPRQRLWRGHEELVAARVTPPPPRALPLRHAHPEKVPRRGFSRQRDLPRGRPSPPQRRPQHRRRVQARRRLERRKMDTRLSKLFFFSI